MERTTQLVAFVAVAWSIAGLTRAQQPLHYFHSSQLPPGTVGYGQLQRFPHLVGYNQPVQLVLPEGARVAFLSDHEATEPQPAPLVVGMQVGSVYQLKVTNIPFELGQEVFPTIEIVNRTYPPAGQQLRFPVPIELTQEELELALQGRYVTRVIYLEDRALAFGHADEPGQQRYFESAPGQDPLRVADQLGRPLAILRMGSRVPDIASGQTGLGPHPTPLLYSQQQIASVGADTRRAVEREGQNIPRTPLPARTATRLRQPAGLNLR